MKNLLKYSLTISLLLLLSSCASSIHVVNNWKGDNASTIKKQNVLVVARTDNQKIRQAFETQIAKELRAKGIKATESFIKHPTLKPNEKVTEDQQFKIKELLAKEGYNAVVLSVLKDKIVNVKATEEGGYYAGESLRSYYPAVIPVYYYHSGFYGYYYNPKSYSSYGTYVEKSVETRTSNSFVLETLGFNLDLPEEKQLVAYVTTKIDEPDNIDGTAKIYAKKIVKSFY